MTYSEYVELRNKAGVTDYRVNKDLRLGNALYKWRVGQVNPRKLTRQRIAKYLEGKIWLKTDL